MNNFFKRLALLYSRDMLN